MTSNSRDKFATKFGFIIAAASSAIGLGNLWRFPYVAGSNGGAIFIVIYIAILIFIGIPILLTEMSVGRASRKSISQSFEVLEKPNTKWHWAKYPMIFANYLVMGYYPIIAAWLIYYFIGISFQDFLAPSNSVDTIFTSMITESSGMVYIYGFLALLFCSFISWFSISRGLERFSRPLMLLLFLTVFGLIGYSCSLPNAIEGVKNYLIPDFSKVNLEYLINTCNAALGQAVFTLSIGVGMILVFASYMDREKSLPKEALWVCTLDTMVAIGAGLIIFPACASFGIETTQGPSLLFKSMVRIFQSLGTIGVWFGATFFLLAICAAVSSVLTIFENLNAIVRDGLNVSRQTAVVINTIIVGLISLPAAYGYGPLSWISIGDLGIIDIEDYIFSNILMPLGAVVFAIFCVARSGWHNDGFYNEVNTGSKWKLPKFSRWYLKYAIPTFIIAVFISANWNTIKDLVN